MPVRSLQRSGKRGMPIGWRGPACGLSRRCRPWLRPGVMPSMPRSGAFRSKVPPCGRGGSPRQILKLYNFPAAVSRRLYQAKPNGLANVNDQKGSYWTNDNLLQALPPLNQKRKQVLSTKRSCVVSSMDLDAGLYPT